MDNTEIERIEIDVETQQAIKQLKKFQKAYESSINSSKIQQNAVKAANSINKSLKTTTQAASKTVKGISNMANKTVSAIKSTVNKTTKSITNALKKSINTAKKLGMQFGKAFVKTIANTITKGIKGLMKVFKTLTRTLMKSIASVIKGSSNLIGKAFKGVFNGVNKLVSSSIRGIINTAKKSLQGFSNLLDEVLEEKKLELEVNATAGSKGGSKQKSSGGSGMASALMNAGLISSSLKTMTKAIASNNIGGLNGEIVAKFASKMIDAGEKTLAFGSFVYKAYRLFKQYWPNILDAFGKISERVAPILKRGFTLVTEAVGNLLSKGMTIVVNKLAEVPGKLFPIVKNGFMKLINSAGDIFQKGIDAMLNSNNPKIRALGVLLQFITDLLKKLSPVLMSVIDGFGGFLNALTDLINGMDFSALTNTIADVFSQLIMSVRNIASYFSPYLSQTVKALVGVFEKSGNVIISVFKTIENVSNVLSPLGKIVAPLIEVFGGLIDISTSLFNGFTSIVNKLSPALKGFVDLIGTQLATDISKFAGLLKSVSEALPSFFNAFGEAILPAAERFINTFSKLLLSIRGVFKSFNDTVIKFLNKFGITGDSLVEVFMKLGNKLGSSFSGVLNFVSKGMEKLCSVIDTVAENLPTFLEAFGTAILPSLKRFANTFSKVTAVIGKVFNALKDTIVKFLNKFGITGDSITETFRNLGNKVGTHLGSIIDFVCDGLDLLCNGLNHVADNMDTYLTPVLEGIVKVFNWAKDTMTKCIDALRNAFANNIQKIKTAFGTFFNSIKGLIKTIFGSLGEIANHIGKVFNISGNTVGDACTKIANFLLGGFATALDYTGQLLEYLSLIIRDVVTPALKFIVNIVKYVYEGIKGFIKGFASNIDINGLFASLESSIKNIWGIIEQFGKVVGNAFGSVEDGASSFTALGAACGKLINGFGTLLNNVTAFALELSRLLSTYLGPIFKDLVTVVNWVFQKLAELTKGFSVSMNSNMNNIAKAFRGALDSILGYVYNLWNALKEVISYFGKVFGFTADSIGDSGMTLANFISGTLVTAFNVFKDALHSISYILETVTVPVIKFFVDNLKWLYDRFAAFVQGFTGAFNVGGKIKELLNAFAVNLRAGVNLVITFRKALMKIIDALGVGQLIDFLLRNLGKAIGKLLNFISNIILAVLDLDGFVRDMLAPVVEFIGDLLAIFAGAIKNTVKIIPTLFELLGDVIKDFINSLKEKFPILGKVIDGFVEVVKAVTWPFRKAIEVVTSWFGKLLSGIKSFFFWLRKERQEKFTSHVTADQRLKAEKVKESKDTQSLNDNFKDLYGTDMYSVLDEKVKKSLNEYFKTGEDANSKAATDLVFAIQGKYKELAAQGEVIDGLVDSATIANTELGNAFINSFIDFRNRLSEAIPDTMRGLMTVQNMMDLYEAEAKSLAKYGKSIINDSEGIFKSIKDNLFNQIVSSMNELDRQIKGSKDIIDIETAFKDITGKDLEKLFIDVTTNDAEDALENFRKGLEEDYKAISNTEDRTKAVNRTLVSTINALKAFNNSIVTDHKANDELRKSIASFDDSINKVISSTDILSRKCIEVGNIGVAAGNAKDLGNEPKSSGSSSHDSFKFVTDDNSDLDERHKKMEELLKTSKLVRKENSKTVQDLGLNDFENINFDNIELPKDIKDVLDKYKNMSDDFDTTGLEDFSDLMRDIKENAEGTAEAFKGMEIPNFDTGNAPKLGKIGGDYKPAEYQKGKEYKPLEGFNLDDLKSKLSAGLEQIVLDTVEDFNVDITDAPEITVAKFKEAVYQNVADAVSDVNSNLTSAVSQTGSNAPVIMNGENISSAINETVKVVKTTVNQVKGEIEEIADDLQFPDIDVTKEELVKRVFGGDAKFNPSQFVKENFDVDGIIAELDKNLNKEITDTPVELEEITIEAPKINIPTKTTKEFTRHIGESLASSFKEITDNGDKFVPQELGDVIVESVDDMIDDSLFEGIANSANKLPKLADSMTSILGENISAGIENNVEKFVPLELGNEVLDSIEDVINDSFQAKSIEIKPIKVDFPEIEGLEKSGSQSSSTSIEDVIKPTKEFSEYAKSLADNVKDAFNTQQSSQFAQNINSMADAMEQQVEPAMERITIEVGNINRETEKVKRTASTMFQPKDYSNVLDGVLDGLEQTEQQAQEAGSQVQQIFSDSEFANVNSTLNETAGNVEELKFNLSGLDTEFDEVGESARQAADNISDVAEQDSFAKFFNDLKAGFTSTLDAVDAYVDMADDIEKVLHPVKALKQEINTKVTSSLFGTTTKQVKDLKDQFVVFRDQVKAFKESDLKGFDRLKAKLQLMGQQAKLQMKQFKLIFKTNAISKLIKRMQGPVEKETRELAEKSPGGKENIGLFQGGLKKLALLFGGIGIGSIIKTSTQEAIGFESAMMLLNARLGESVSILNDFASTRGLELGLSKANIAEFGNIFSVYVSQFAKDTEEMANTTRDLLEAAAITAQSTGYTMTDVMESFRSGLTGSVEALDQYGINVKVAALESSAAFREIANGAESWDQLTQAQQQQIISMNIVSQVHKNFGNGIRNTNTILLQFQAALANVRLALGNTFKVILSAVLPPLTVLLQALEVVLNKVTQFVTALLGLFGIEVSFDGLGGSGAGAGGLNDLGDSVDNIANSGDGVKDTADNISGVGDAAKDAADKASELNKQLLGIDELNTIQTRTDSNSGSGGSGDSGGTNGGSGLDSALGGLGGLNSFDINPLEKTISESASRMAEALKTIGEAFMEGWNRNLPYLQESLDRLEASFGRLKEAGKNLFKDIWENGGKELVTNIGGLASAFAGSIIDISSEWIDTIAQVFEHLAPSNNPTTQYFLDSMNSFVKSVEGLLLTLGDHFRSFKENGGQDLINTLADIGMAFSGFAFDLGSQAVDAIANFLDHLDPSNNPKTQKFIDGLNYLAESIETFITSAGGWFKTFMQNGGQAFLNNLGDIAMALGSLAAELGGDIITLITDFLNSWVGQALIEGIAKALELVSIAIEEIITWLSDHPGVVESFLAAWGIYKASTTVVAWANGIALFCSEAKALITMLGGDLIAKLGGFFGMFKGGAFLTGLKGMLSGAWGAISGFIGGIWTAVSGAISSILTAIAGFFGVSVGWVVAAIAAIIAAVVLIWKNWDKICAWCKKAWKKLCDWAPKAWKKVCETVEKLMDGIVEFFEDAWDTIKEIWSKVKEWAIGVKDKVLSAWSDFKSKLGDLFGKAWKAAKDKFNDAKKWAGDTYKKVIDAWNTFKSDLSKKAGDAWKAAKDKFNDAKTWSQDTYKKVIDAWNTFKSDLSKKAGDAWKAAKDKFNDAQTWSQDTYKKVIDAWNTFKSDLSKKAGDAWKEAKDKFNDAKTWAGDTYKKVIDSWNTFKSDLGTKFSDAWSNAKGKFTQVKEWGQDVVSKIREGFANFSLTDYFSTAWSNAKSKFSSLKEWGLNTVIPKIREGFANFSVADYFSNAWSNAKGKFTQVKEWGQGVVKNIKSGISGLDLTWYFSEAWKNAKAKFTGVGTWASGIANTIKDKFKSMGSGIGTSISNGLRGAINSAINTIQNFINGAIKVINKLPGVEISPIYIPRIPALAKGGITNGPTTALIGEAGREAVLPLENNTGWMDELADKLSSRMSNGSTNNMQQTYQNPNITINIGGTKFGEIAASEINRAQRRAGRVLIDL